MVTYAIKSVIYTTIW